MIKLQCKARNWHWGKPGLDSLVGKAYLQSVPALPENAELYQEADQERYAELWIGDHQNGPCELKITKGDPQLALVINDEKFLHHYAGKEVEIGELFKHNPERFLGRAHLEKFAKDNELYSHRMAFLLKLLAVDKAISIQAHPNQSLSEKLHAARPDVYRDETHKPEIGVALNDEVASCFGFLNKEKLTQMMRENRVLAQIFGYEEGVTEVGEIFLKGCVHKLFYELDQDQESLLSTVKALESDINDLPETSRSEHQKLFLTLIV